MSDQPKIDRLIKDIVAGASTVQIEFESRELDVNEVGSHGRTPLMVAAAEGMLAAVDALMRIGASAHAAGRGQMTALHEASGNGEVAIVDYLLLHGADVNAETNDRVTPLMCAAAWGQIEVAKLLLEKGADGKKTDRTGATAADIALEKGEDSTAALINSYLETLAQSQVLTVAPRKNSNGPG